MLTAYFDESGVTASEQLCVVAGFVGNDAQWLAFIADWIQALKPRKNLHMRKLRWNQYPDSISRALSDLGPIPHKYNLQPVYSGMWWRDYEEIMKGKVREKFTTPYMTCAQACMSTVLREIVQTDEVMFVFDRQHVHRRAIEALDSLVFGIIGVDSRVKGLTFTTAKQTVCLDPSDYLAYQLLHVNVDPNSTRAKMGMSILDVPAHGSMFTREELTRRTDEWVNAGMVPGGGPIKPTRELLQKLTNNPYWRGPKQ
jgi:hypothetical protein